MIQRRLHSGALLLCALNIIYGAAMTACSDDLPDGIVPAGGIDDSIIRFVPTMKWADTDSAATLGSRAAEADTASVADPVLEEIIPLDGCNAEGDSLFLHVYSEPMPDADTPEEEPEGAGDSRASLVTAASNFHSSFALIGFQYTGAWAATNKPNMMHNVSCTKSGTLYVPAKNYYWPGASYKLRFFAVAPYGTATLTDANTADVPKLTYTVPTDMTKQSDVLGAYSGEIAGNAKTDVAMNFTHLLAAVKFQQSSGMMKGTVNSIALKNIYSKGTCNLSTKAWSGQATAASYTQTLNKGVTGANNGTITTAAQNFMVLPQTAPTNASLEVIYTDSLTNTKRTMTASLSGTKWEAGKTYTYKLSTTSVVVEDVFTLDVTTAQTVGYTGGSVNFSILSHKKVTRAGDATKYVAAPWTVKFQLWNDATAKYEDTSTKPSWLPGCPTSGTGNSNTTATTYTINIPASPVGTNIHDDEVKNATALGSATAPYNLSNATGAKAVENTANCYIVSAPGTYCIPPIEGNKIANSANNVDNCTVYTSQNTAGTSATATRIHSASACLTGIDGAQLVWEDVKGLITGVTTCTGTNFTHANSSAANKGVQFTINQSVIKQGNAVIAATKGGQIVWSWHIWVTPPLSIVNFGGYLSSRIVLSGNIMSGYRPENSIVKYLGSKCSGLHYHQRMSKLIFTQTGTGKTLSVILGEGPAHFCKYEQATLYQWGRKDPFPYGTYYDKSGTAKTTVPSAAFSNNRNTVAQPLTLRSNAYTDGERFMSYWCTGFNVSTQPSLNSTYYKKSVFDPCPVGYCVPAGDVFSGFVTKTNYNISTSTNWSERKLKGEWDSGWNFYNGGIIGEYTIFPATESSWTTSGFAKRNFTRVWTQEAATDPSTTKINYVKSLKYSSSMIYTRDYGDNKLDLGCVLSFSE